MKNINRLLTAGTVIVILAFWAVATNLSWVDTRLIPTPQAVGIAFLTICRNGYKNYSLLAHLSASLQRLMVAFVLSVVTAIPLGLASGYSGKFRAVLEPVIEFYRPLPPLAYYTLLVLWLGIENESKIALLYLACFAPIYVSCVSAVMKITPDYINSAATLGAGKGQIFLHVILPSCLPDVFIGMRTALGVGYTTLVAAEMVAAKSGIGWMVLDASNYLRSDIIFVGIILLGVTGIVLDRILRLLEKAVIPWKGKV